MRIFRKNWQGKMPAKRLALSRSWRFPGPAPRRRHCAIIAARPLRCGKRTRIALYRLVREIFAARRKGAVL